MEIFEKKLTAENGYLFSQKNPPKMFGRVVNRPCGNFTLEPPNLENKELRITTCYNIF